MSWFYILLETYGRSICHSSYWLLRKYFRARVEVTSSSHMELEVAAHTWSWKLQPAGSGSHQSKTRNVPIATEMEMWSAGSRSRLKEIISTSFNSTRDSETRLLEEAKRCRAELERLQAGAAEPGGPEEPESEVTHLRRQLLGAYDQLKAAEDRDYKTQHKLKWLVTVTRI